MLILNMEKVLINDALFRLTSLFHTFFLLLDVHDVTECRYPEKVT